MYKKKRNAFKSHWNLLFKRLLMVNCCNLKHKKTYIVLLKLVKHSNAVTYIYTRVMRHNLSCNVILLTLDGNILSLEINHEIMK